MFRALAVTAFAALVFAAHSEALALGDYNECRVTAVKDAGAFENEYDFTFSDSPYVVIDLRTPDTKLVTIGTLSFSDKDANQPSAIRLVQAYGGAGIEIAPQDSGERFYVRVNFRQGTGELQREVNGAWSQVAELSCPGL